MIQSSQSGKPELASVLRAGVAPEQGPATEILAKLLRAVRTHLRMEGAFIGEFEQGRRVFRVVDAEPGKCAIPVGAGDPLEESYCQRVVDGRLPELIRNAQDLPAAQMLPVTADFPIGAHVSIPLRFPDGTVYGTFCCFSRIPDYSLNARDLELMHTFADLAMTVIERDRHERDGAALRRVQVESVLNSDALSIVYQPIVNIESERIVGFESLARFATSPARTPDLWFEEASRVGLGERLEVLAIKHALARGRLGDSVYVACNVSPEVVLQGGLPAALRDCDLSGIVLEITEHANVENYVKLHEILRPLREQGMRLAVDDAGAGYSSFRHILRLQPEYIKLDISLTRDIDSDRGRRALAAALIGFAGETGSELTAEGVETVSEFETLRQLGVHRVQGFLLGRPVPFEVARELAGTRAVAH